MMANLSIIKSSLLINIFLFIIPESDTSIQEDVTLKSELDNLLSNLKNEVKVF